MSSNPSSTVSYHPQVEPFWTELAKVVIGRQKEFKLLFASLLTQGHVLLEDLPGTGKTTMVKAFAKVLDCRFTRIQCTPDLLPSDVLGVSIFNPNTNDFTLRKGPVFTNVLLVDEINRALPRTQSCLLECMEEDQVSIDGQTHALAAPFMVLATQNPVDMEGTFPLPEAQLDRFLMKLKLGYPTLEEEQLILQQVGDAIPYEAMKTLFHPEQLAAMQQTIREVQIHPSIIAYITSLAHETRKHPLIKIGVSPRASKAMYKTVKSWAYLHGRDYVIPDDVKDVIISVWSHRLMLHTEARIKDIQPEELLEEIIHRVSLPEEQVVRL